MLYWLLVSSSFAWSSDPDPSQATVPTDGDPVVEAALTEAMRYADLPWTWSGRDTTRLPGIDCLGLVFRSYGAATDTSWRAYSVDPSKLVASGLLGSVVPGLDGVVRDELDSTLLQRGDVVYFLMREQPIPDDPLHVDASGSYWPWHVGVYVGEGEELVLNAHPSHDVVRMPLSAMRWDALTVTRPRP